MPPPDVAAAIRDGLILQTMLSGLGLLTSPGADELAESVERYLAGTERDLAEMFLGKKDPVPGDLWPHPLWHPRWRLWLALWLEQRGERGAALQVARPARDERYGLTNCQPALAALLGRL
jgi:hypothetical protein